MPHISPYLPISPQEDAKDGRNKSLDIVLGPEEVITSQPRRSPMPASAPPAARRPSASHVARPCPPSDDRHRGRLAVGLAAGPQGA